MSIPRYTLQSGSMAPSPSGGWIRWEDYQRALDHDLQLILERAEMSAIASLRSAIEASGAKPMHHQVEEKSD